MLTVVVRLYDTDLVSNAQGATQMSSFPCISDFRTPYDAPGPYDHCHGQFNVSLGGVEWTVDFDYNEPIVYVGTVDVTDCLKNSTLHDILENARSQHDEVDV